MFSIYPFIPVPNTMNKGFYVCTVYMLPDIISTYKLYFSSFYLSTPLLVLSYLQSKKPSLCEKLKQKSGLCFLCVKISDFIMRILCFFLYTLSLLLLCVGSFAVNTSNRVANVVADHDDLLTQQRPIKMSKFRSNIFLYELLPTTSEPWNFSIIRGLKVTYFHFP